MRVRAFTQDDAHIFCTEEQVATETAEFVALLDPVYRDLGFTDFRVKFSDRPEKRAGDDATWDKAEGALKEACRRRRRVRAEPGGGRLLRPEAGIRAARCHRPRLAVRHPAGRFRAAGAAGRGLCGEDGNRTAPSCCTAPSWAASSASSAS
jgi:hypothetical protein